MQAQLIYAFDIFGTVIFAITGALCGVEHKFDLLGVVVFGCLVGTGGGMLRDVLIGSTPVAALNDESYLMVSIISALVVFFVARWVSNLRKLIAIGDAIGLGVFAAIGAAKGVTVGLHPIGVILSGTLTAVGGGIIRDIMTRSIPVVLTSDFYATAALLGGGLYWLLQRFSDWPQFSIFMSVFVFVTGLRLTAMYLKLRLPTATEFNLDKLIAKGPKDE